MKKIILTFSALLMLGGLLAAQNCDVSPFRKPITTVDSLFKIHTGSWARLSVTKVEVAKNGKLDFHFNESLSDFPIRPDTEEWLRSTLQNNLPDAYSEYQVGRIFIGTRPIDYLVVPSPGNDGIAPISTLSKTANKKSHPLIDRGIDAPMGLSGRHIALWQSHGRYFNLKHDSWMWQRACIFQIVEDLSTQSYVVPFLVPMLENAGATVFLPRERDYHKEEIIIDNDPFEMESGRSHGFMEFQGKWQHAGLGFADAFPDYRKLCNPFELGSCLGCKCSPSGNSHAIWHGEIPSRGEWAVYVSYASRPNSSRRAEYTVHSLGGDRTVFVNQRIGGGGWVYIGTYEFEKGVAPLVTLSNRTSDRGVVVADAVKIGGGMGNIARGTDSTGFKTSGMPRFCEGSRYFMQWSGVPHEVWSQNEESDDYRDDFMSRGKWVQHLCGGSRFAPKSKGLGIPVDLSLAFHTDAGTRPDDRIIGTLAIYTRICDNSSKLPSGESRDRCRELTDMMQTQIVDDIRALCDTAWTRRMLWNRSYSESRTTGVPAVLMELLSHQNFEDMKYGLDPQFRFMVSRACYKSMLKFLSLRYGCPYVVQPLPVEQMSAKLDAELGTVNLRWTPAEDKLEPTASPDAYFVYRRIDGGGWDGGRKVTGCTFSEKIEPGHIYSYKVVASNGGGLSFPSEVLSVGMPYSNKGKVLIVNNFTRTSGPTWFDEPGYAGFDNRSDSGVPYLRDWSYIGDQFEFRRRVDYVSDDNCGFGSSYEDYSDIVVAGNSFDYPYIHGMSIMKAGYAFESCSSSALGSEECPLWSDCIVADIICGKQCRVRTANRTPVRDGVFPDAVRSALTAMAARGCNIMISGCYIGTDSFGSVFPIDYSVRKRPEREAGTLEHQHADQSRDIVLIDRSAEQQFIKEVLGYSLRRSHATKSGEVVRFGVPTLGNSLKGIASFPVKPDTRTYSAESCDALYPVGVGSQIYMGYRDSGLTAAIVRDFGKRRVAAFGFPLEIITSSESRDAIFEDTLRYLTGK